VEPVKAAEPPALTPLPGFPVITPLPTSPPNPPVIPVIPPAPQTVTPPGHQDPTPALKEGSGE
jgi:hypothetical protein